MRKKYLRNLSNELAQKNVKRRRTTVTGDLRTIVFKEVLHTVEEKQEKSPKNDIAMFRH